MIGTIFDIKRFAVHDGPGIRTTVFVKGCMLRCPWCQNPEGLSGTSELWWFERPCIGCGHCIETCPDNALSMQGTRIVIDRANCTRCGVCVEVCPSRALAFDGREEDSEAVIEEILKDKVFFDVSGGGATLSGGDPLTQPAFSQAVLSGCRARGIHTALETCLAVRWAQVEPFLEVVNLFLVDLKLGDEDEHEGTLGVPASHVKSNIARLVERGADVCIRVPLIPGVTATEENLEAIGGFVRREVPRVPVELINYNPLARAKYMRRGLDTAGVPGHPTYSREQMHDFYEAMKLPGSRPGAGR